MTKGEKTSKFEAFPGIDPGFCVRHFAFAILGANNSKLKAQSEFNIHSLSLCAMRFALFYNLNPGILESSTPWMLKIFSPLKKDPHRV